VFTVRVQEIVSLLWAMPHPINTQPYFYDWRLWGFRIPSRSCIVLGLGGAVAG
jgi:hypothetical protein